MPTVTWSTPYDWGLSTQKNMSISSRRYVPGQPCIISALKLPYMWNSRRKKGNTDIRQTIPKPSKYAGTIWGYMTELPDWMWKAWSPKISSRSGPEGPLPASTGLSFLSASATAIRRSTGTGSIIHHIWQMEVHFFEKRGFRLFAMSFFPWMCNLTGQNCPFPALICLALFSYNIISCYVDQDIRCYCYLNPIRRLK